MKIFSVTVIILSLFLSDTLSQLNGGRTIAEPDYLNAMRRFGTFESGLLKKIAEHYAYRQKIREEISGLKDSLKNKAFLREQMKKQRAIQNYIDANRLGSRQFLRDFHTNRF